MWALIDNYDSFTYILHHYLLELHPEVQVWKNDAIRPDVLEKHRPEAIIFSPGPQGPEQGGFMLDIIDAFHARVPLLGICLGHQAIAHYFGARVEKALRPMHGITDQVYHQERGIFAGLPDPMQVMRYHSLVVKTGPAGPLEVLAQTAEGEIMALKHRHFPCWGLQFHPESVGTPLGARLLKNWKAFNGL